MHRDVKPENILLQDDHVFVADFGIGKVISELGDEAMTRTGMSVGTPAYLSPEQAAGEQVDERSDQYALACVLYETLVGEPPFTGPNVQAVIAKRFVQIPADVTALRESVPRSVARALQRAIARTPIDRFPTTSAFADALLARTSTSATASPRTSRMRSLAWTDCMSPRERRRFHSSTSTPSRARLAIICVWRRSSREAFVARGQGYASPRSSSR